MKLVAQAVSYRYGDQVQALEQVDLEVADGEVLAILGPNGAGKTTLVKLFNGLLRPATGRIRVGDWPAQDKTVAELSSRVGLAFQNPGQQLFASSVRDELAFGPRNLGFTDRELQQAVERSLVLFGLEGDADRHPYDLIASRRKLVSIAAVCAMQTPVVILDEPTAGLDPAERQLVADSIAELRGTGCTVLIVTHDIEFAADHCRRTVVLSAGKIIGDGTAESLLTDHRLLQTASLEPPQLVRLASELAMPTRPISGDAFLTAWSQWKEGMG